MSVWSVVTDHLFVSAVSLIFSIPNYVHMVSRPLSGFSADGLGDRRHSRCRWGGQSLAKAFHMAWRSAIAEMSPTSDLSVPTDGKAFLRVIPAAGSCADWMPVVGVEFR